RTRALRGRRSGERKMPSRPKSGTDHVFLVEQAAQIDRKVGALEQTLLAVELAAFRLEIDDPDFLGTRAEVRRNFLLQFLNRVGRRCDFNANLRRIHQWRLGAMQAIELGASPGGVCHEEPKGRGYG